MAKKQPVTIAPKDLSRVDLEACQFQLADALRKNDQLRVENRALADNYAQQKDLTTELQTSLLKQHQEAGDYLQLTERLVGELARKTAEPPDPAKQIETARFLAEVVDVLITTMKRDTLDSTQKDLLYWAEQYLAESKIEIEKNNVEGAAYLFRQAMEQIQQNTAYTNGRRQEEIGKGITFQTPMPMKVLKNCNLRTGPSTQAKVLKTLNVGSPVNALGYKGKWVYVSLAGQGSATGWIYSSLLH